MPPVYDLENHASCKRFCRLHHYLDRDESALCIGFGVLCLPRLLGQLRLVDKIWTVVPVAKDLRIPTGPPEAG